MSARKYFKPTALYKAVKNFALLVRRSDGIVCPVQQQSRTANLFRAILQIFVNYQFIALFHHRRKAFIFIASEMLFRVFRKEPFYTPVRIYPPNIPQRTRFYDSRTAADDEFFGKLAALRQYFESHPCAERMSDNIRAAEL